MSLKSILYKRLLEYYNYGKEVNPDSEYDIDMRDLSYHADILLKKAAFGAYTKLRDIPKMDKKVKIAFALSLYDAIGNPATYDEARPTSDVALAVDHVHSKGLNPKFIIGKFKTGTRGEYIDQTSKDIRIYYQEGFIEDINQLKAYNEFTPQALYKLFIQRLKSTTMHELKHFYDDYRSEGQFANTKQYKKYLSAIDTHQQSNAVSRVDKDKADNEIYKQYVNLPHEISAKFVQTIHKLNLNKPLKDVLNDLAFVYDSWDLLNSKDRKILSDRLTIYWNKKHNS